MFHTSLHHLRALAPMTLAMIKKPVKRVLRAKDIVVCVKQDLRDRIVKVVGDLKLQFFFIISDIAVLPRNIYSLFCKIQNNAMPES